MNFSCRSVASKKYVRNQKGKRPCLGECSIHEEALTDFVRGSVLPRVPLTPAGRWARGGGVSRLQYGTQSRQQLLSLP